MFRIYFLSAMILLLLGCSHKKEDALLQKFVSKSDYHKKLQKTEKVQLYEQNVTKATLAATYLFDSTFENNDTRDEKFIVGIYLEDDEPSAFNRYGYHLTLDGQEPIKIEKISHNDIVLKDISFISEWASYTLVTFPHNNKKHFDLTFRHEQYGKGKLHFAKVAKYTFNKKVF